MTTKGESAEIQRKERLGLLRSKKEENEINKKEITRLKQVCYALSENRQIEEVTYYHQINLLIN